MWLMKLLRNPEVRRTVMLFSAVGIMCCIVMWYYWQDRGLWIGILSYLLYTVLYLWQNGKCYRRIASMTNRLDAVLHGEESGLLEDCTEGELAILHSELEKLLLRLREQSEQLQSDKTFLAESLADISHQIKTPLTSVRLVLEQLNDTEAGPEERQKMVHEAVCFIERIDWLVYALLKLSRLDSGTVQFQKEVIDVRDLVQKAVEPLAVSMDVRGILWDCQIAEGIYFEGDRRWSTEALTNIIKNCMEYTSAGGRIIVRAVGNAIYTGLEIRDTGEDIPAEDLPHLFERFYRGSQTSGGGVGIGLSLSQKIIQSQNGTIRVFNHPQGGPVFAIRFYKGVI